MDRILNLQGLQTSNETPGDAAVLSGSACSTISLFACGSGK